MQDKGKTELLLVISCAWPVRRHFPSTPSPSPPPPEWGHLTVPGKVTQRGKSLLVPNTCISLPTCCQVPHPGCMAFEAQCLSAAVPLISGPLCVLPYCLVPQKPAPGDCPSRRVGSKSGFRAAVRSLCLAMHILATFLWRVVGKNTTPGSWETPVQCWAQRKSSC